MADPFSTVYNAIWAAIEDVPELAALVKTNNRIKFDDRDPIKDEMDDSDLPELRVLPSSAEPRKPAASNMYGVTETYEIGLIYGDKRLSDNFFLIKWHLLRAVKNIQDTLPAVDISAFANGSVKSALPIVVRDEPNQGEDSRGIEGWTSVWEIEVVMIFQASAIV